MKGRPEYIDPLVREFPGSDIGNGFYCTSYSYYKGRKGLEECLQNGGPYTCCKFECRSYQLKWPTPEQYKEVYGREWDGAVYILETYGGFPPGKEPQTFESIWRGHDPEEVDKGDWVVCACTPWGKPPNDWRPE